MDGMQNTMEAPGIDAAAEEQNEKSKEGGLKLNVSKPERWISAALGAGLLYYGVRKRTLFGTLLALAGGNLLLRGTLGRSLIYRGLGINTAVDAGNTLKKTLLQGNFKVEKSIVIDRAPEEVYRFWRNIENLPRIMKHLKSVRSIDDRRSHWVAKAPAGIEIEWDAEITDELDNRRISWRSLEGSEIKNNGVVLFEPLSDGRATELRVYLEYNLPAGKLAKTFSKVIGKNPDKIVDEDLNRFKSLMETGEAAYGQMARG
ncbi:MAG: SRPBCC family protein [Fibrobacterota bacterium]|nr:SRPBCC family protein [Fibrobacterota bacterium]